MNTDEHEWGGRSRIEPLFGDEIETLRMPILNHSLSQ